MSQHLRIHQLTPSIGAIVEGIGLNDPLDQQIIQEVREAFVKHHVIFFRDQTITPDRQRDVAKEFGELHIHPIYPKIPGIPEIIVLDTHNDNPQDNNKWHTDVTYIQTPPMGSLLAAKMLPPIGGDTLWLSCIAAYNALSETLRSFLDTLTAIHDIRKGYPTSGGDEESYQKACRNNPPVTHPVVRVHPVSGLKGLFVNEANTTRINELTKEESDALLQFLFQHVTKPDFCVRWKWREGDVAFWDNRLTQHYVCSDYAGHRRIMHRATIIGDKPRGSADA